MKKFYNRQKELKALQTVSEQIVKTKGQLSVMVGRRRVGKTRLLNEAFQQENTQFLYLFISRKSENSLVAEFAEIINSELGVKFFQPQSLRDIIEFLLDYTKQKPLTIIIDEFQDIDIVNPALFSDIQNLWDANKRDSMMHLVCCGSLYSMMTKIFKGKDEPLFNRDDRFFKIQPLQPSYIAEVMKDHDQFDAENMLRWWCLSGGIPKYLEWLTRFSAENDDLFEAVISEFSPLIKEGTHRLVEDFGSEHRIYFDILGAISKGNTSRARIENFLGMSVGVHLEKLDEVFDVITKKRPISSKENSRDIRYSISDPFLNFWFRFIHANKSAVEMENYEYIRRYIERDFTVYSGLELESLFVAILVESKQFGKIGGYWDAKGHNEIDIVAINDLDKKILIAEVKRQQKRYSEAKLIEKSHCLLQKLNLKGYDIEYRGFSLDNLVETMKEYQA
ncbi:ATP-binding protein [Vibrio metschnikovii]|jgi:AAA+ ATPase superfamily predicted ATPase|uniref:ATP-binding protein n=4 Tax=Bacteria TaxID=2 RepID=A0AAU6TNX1_UNCXX|nr:ATP-binding protein [Vibrio metschnikovii]EKO3640707.1 ATP-binding protein [Vibrio metschnikovii]EKO3698103.1 ATP-binding protein [Vibrio metschnikovii]EKO3718534.1 ATP-binding protein [Vibrio metschnikovii]EKO3722596.1 ATP-binding protein [Vibrio metschnikovii]